MGEVFNSIWDCQQLITEQLIDYIRADVVHAGGITHLRRIFQLAELYHVRSGSHGANDLSPVCLAAALHLDISIPNFGIQEYMRHSARPTRSSRTPTASRTATSIPARSPAWGSTSMRSWRRGTRTSVPTCRPTVWSTGRCTAGEPELRIPPIGALDLVSLGALVIRLDPGDVPFQKATECRIHVSGAEYNVAANLAGCFGLRTAVASACVDYPIGQLVAERVRAMGVRGIYRWSPHDGVRGPNIATVYSDRGFGIRPPVVFYNRAEEAAALLGPGDFDWAEIFGDGVRWFHSGGLFAALSEPTSELIVEGMRAARAAGAVVSFDLNYRDKLWRTHGGQERARAVIGRIVENVDVLLGNEEDVQQALGISGPDLRAEGSVDPSGFVALMGRVRERYPTLAVMATTLRDVRSANRHLWSAVASVGGEVMVAPTCELDVYDRVGGGDGFAAGLVYRAARGGGARAGAAAGVGAWCAGHRLPGRHHHGDARPGPRRRRRGGGADPAVGGGPAPRRRSFL